MKYVHSSSNLNSRISIKQLNPSIHLLYSRVNTKLSTLCRECFILAHSHFNGDLYKKENCISKWSQDISWVTVDLINYQGHFWGVMLPVKLASLCINLYDMSIFIQRSMILSFKLCLIRWLTCSNSNFLCPCVYTQCMCCTRASKPPHSWDQAELSGQASI